MPTRHWSSPATQIRARCRNALDYSMVKATYKGIQEGLCTVLIKGLLGCMQGVLTKAYMEWMFPFCLLSSSVV